MSQDFANKNQQSARRRNNNFVFIFRSIRAPRCCNNVEVGSGAGTEGGWCEIDLRNLHIVESLVQSFKFIVFFFELDQKSSLQGGVKRIHDF